MRIKTGGLRATFVFAAIVYGQPAAPPHFSVASIKAGGHVFSTTPERTTGRIRWTTQLCYLIGYSYSLDFSLISTPKCGSVYSVEATFDPAATDDAVRLMLQSLLADRFRMQAHRVSTEASGFALLIGKGGLRIKAAGDGDEAPSLPEWVKNPSPELKTRTYISATAPEPGVTAITGRRVSIAQLAATLQRVTKTPVWDRTGLTGNYYFSFRFAPELSTDFQPDAPTLEAALKASLGLTLEKQKGPVESLVVDSIAEPSEN